MVYVVHLNDEVCLVNGFILGVLRGLMQNALLFELAQLRAHVVGPQTEIVDDFLSNDVLHISVILLLIDEVDLVHYLLIL